MRRKAAHSRTWVQPRRLPNVCWLPSRLRPIGTKFSAPSIPPQRLLTACWEVSLARKFVFDKETNTYVCPQGKHLRYDAKLESYGSIRYRYKASKQDCQTCPAKDQCCPRTRHGRSIELRVLLPDIADVPSDSSRPTEPWRCIRRDSTGARKVPVNYGINAGTFGLRHERRVVARACGRGSGIESPDSPPA